MKIGDKVRFLNTTGGGTVIGFRRNDIVIVDDDGFDTPILIRECVVIAPAHEEQVRQTTKPNPSLAATISPSVEKRIAEETKDGDSITVCLSYLPMDRKNLSTSSFEAYLVNDSNYYLAYNYMTKSTAGWQSRSCGIAEPNTKLFLEEFDKENLNAMERVCVQFISYKEGKDFALKNPCSVELRIDTVKFYKVHSFRENDYFEEDSLSYFVMRKDLPEKLFSISAIEIQQAMVEKDTPRSRTQPIVRKEKNSIIEIDLHIQELINNTNGLSNSDMLNCQLAKFKEVMEMNKDKKGQKIVFIHGKGDGILKNALLKELKTVYKTAYSQDASFHEYGYGATMITIK